MPPVARHLPGAGVGVVEGQVERLEVQPEQPVRGVEGGLDHRVEAEIGLQFRLIEIMFGQTALFGVIAPVPRLQGAVDTVALHHAGQDGAIGLGLGAGRSPDPHQKIAHRTRRLRHLGFQLVGGETVIAEKLCAFLPQLQDLCRQRAVVGLAPVCPTRDPGAPGGFAQVAAGGELQERHDQRPAERQDMPLPPALCRGGTGGGDDETGQAFKVGLLKRQEPVAFIGQKVLAELRGQNRQPFLDLCHPLAPGLVQRRTGANEHAAVKLKHPALFVGQGQRVLPVPERVDAREKIGVHRHLGRKRRHLRRKLALQRLARGGRVCTGEVVENPRHPVQHLFGQFQRLDRIGEGRRLGRSRDLCDIAPRLGQPGLEGGAEILIPDGGKGWQLERPGPGLKQRVGHARTPFPAL